MLNGIVFSNVLRATLSKSQFVWYWGNVSILNDVFTNKGGIKMGDKNPKNIAKQKKKNVEKKVIPSIS